MHTQIDQERPAHQTEGYLTPGWYSLSGPTPA